MARCLIPHPALQGPAASSLPSGFIQTPSVVQKLSEPRTAPGASGRLRLCPTWPGLPGAGGSGSGPVCDVEAGVQRSRGMSQVRREGKPGLCSGLLRQHGQQAGSSGLRSLPSHVSILAGKQGRPGLATSPCEGLSQSVPTWRPCTWPVTSLPSHAPSDLERDLGSASGTPFRVPPPGRPPALGPAPQPPPQPAWLAQPSSHTSTLHGGHQPALSLTWGLWAWVVAKPAPPGSAMSRRPYGAERLSH